MAKGEFLARGVVVCIGTGKFTGKQRQGCFLTEYDEGADTYVGVVFPRSEFFQQMFQHQGKGEFTEFGAPMNVGVVQRIEGLRRYPYAERPDYAFQFVLPDEDTTPLREIMQRNADAAQSGVPTGQEPTHEVIQDSETGEQSFDPADTNKDGVVDKAERKAAKKKDQ